MVLGSVISRRSPLPGLNRSVRGITSVPGALRVYVTTIPATDRRVTLLRDPIYRLDVAHNAMGYFQVPMPSVDLESTRGR